MFLTKRHFRYKKQHSFRLRRCQRCAQGLFKREKGRGPHVKPLERKGKSQRLCVCVCVSVRFVDGFQRNAGTTLSSAGKVKERERYGMNYYFCFFPLRQRGKESCERVSRATKDGEWKRQSGVEGTQPLMFREVRQRAALHFHKRQQKATVAFLRRVELSASMKKGIRIQRTPAREYTSFLSLC